MRAAAAALAALAVLSAAPAAEARKTVEVPAAFRAVLPKVRARTRVPILLPASMRLDFDRGQRLYASGAGRRSGYALELAPVRLCRGATACFGATFTARRGGLLGAHTNVALAHGLRGLYRPLRCGASCSPPSIAWRVGHVRYVIQARALPSTRATFVALANSAIRAGRR